jgi:hypothetical protein
LLASFALIVFGFLYWLCYALVSSIFFLIFINFFLFLLGGGNGRWTSFVNKRGWWGETGFKVMMITTMLTGVAVVVVEVAVAVAAVAAAGVAVEVVVAAAVAVG